MDVLAINKVKWITIEGEKEGKKIIPSCSLALKTEQGLEIAIAGIDAVQLDALRQQLNLIFSEGVFKKETLKEGWMEQVDLYCKAIGFNRE